jgi:hypothetical protein
MMARLVCKGSLRPDGGPAGHRQEQCWRTPCPGPAAHGRAGGPGVGGRALGERPGLPARELERRRPFRAPITRAPPWPWWAVAATPGPGETSLAHHATCAGDSFPWGSDVDVFVLDERSLQRRRAGGPAAPGARLIRLPRGGVEPGANGARPGCRSRRSRTRSWPRPRRSR